MRREQQDKNCVTRPKSFTDDLGDKWWVCENQYGDILLSKTAKGPYKTYNESGYDGGGDRGRIPI